MTDMTSASDTERGDQGFSEQHLRDVVIGELRRHDAPITLIEYSADWPVQYEHEERRIREALGDRVLVLEHVGSTSVPGLKAKPIIDICLAVDDPDDESTYVPALEAAGYVLRIREPELCGHRLFHGTDIAVHLHVFAVGTSEIDAMVRFRDRLRSHARDRELYAEVKTQLASRTWVYVQNYADAKSDVVKGILARATEE